MKTIAILLFPLLAANISFAQFKKRDIGDKYMFSDSVTIKDGQDHDVKIFVLASCPKDKWDNYLKAKSMDDSSGLYLAAAMLSVTAKGKLKNPASFIPMQKQIITWNDKEDSFWCNYKLTGRNGFGNLTESEIMVLYNPFK